MSEWWTEGCTRPSKPDREKKGKKKERHQRRNRKDESAQRRNKQPVCHHVLGEKEGKKSNDSRRKREEQTLTANTSRLPVRRVMFWRLEAPAIQS